MLNDVLGSSKILNVFVNYVLRFAKFNTRVMFVNSD